MSLENRNHTSCSKRKDQPDTLCLQQQFHVLAIRLIAVMLRQSSFFFYSKTLSITTQSGLIIASCWQAESHNRWDNQ